jgi:hypothetical protein
MRQITWIFIIAVLALPACSQESAEPLASQATQSPTKAATADFPLSQGAYWIYEGTVKWQMGEQVKEKTLSWKMEVIEVIKREPVVGYVMQGHPLDLAWYKEDRKPSDYVIIHLKPDKFYMASTKVLSRLKDVNDSLSKLVTEGQLFLEFPLLPQKKFCAAEEITRLDGMYCWGVGGEEKVLLRGIKGITSTEPMAMYTLYFATMPDHEIVHFVPTIGFTHFEYVHHGTVSEVDMQLVEYHAGSLN